MKTPENTRKMKAVTVPAPLAFAICDGFKDVECRRCRPIQRSGKLAIHAASRRIGEREYEKWMTFLSERMGLENDVPFRWWYSRQAFNTACGSIVGFCDYEVMRTPPHESVWWDGKTNALRLENAVRIYPPDPILCRGQLGVWTLDDSLAAEVLAAPNDSTMQDEDE